MIRFFAKAAGNNDVDFRRYAGKFVVFDASEGGAYTFSEDSIIELLAFDMWDADGNIGEPDLDTVAKARAVLTHGEGSAIAHWLLANYCG